MLRYNRITNLEYDVLEFNFKKTILKKNVIQWRIQNFLSEKILKGRLKQTLDSYSESWVEEELFSATLIGKLLFSIRLSLHRT